MWRSGDKRGGLRRFLTPALVLGLAVAVGYLAGLIQFAGSLDRDPPKDTPTADAIVVLTGAPARIETAINLLEKGAAKRLLISGVHDQVSLEMIRGLMSADIARFNCCVDIGREAKSTVGNADEAAAWAKERGYKKLIVVTSSYHLPRALLEFERKIDDVELMGYPAFQETVPLENWWLYPGTTRLLVTEYSKFLVAYTRAQLV